MRHIANIHRWPTCVGDNNRGNRSSWAPLLLCLLASSFAAPAYAQTSEDSAAPENDIVVTATKRSERLIEVPVAISVIDSAAMASQNLVTIKDYVARVPGLSTLDQGNGLVQVAIRGITTGGLSNSTVGVTIDDIPVGGSTGLTYGAVLVPELDPAIIQRVEVLKGPQGTLYGASSLGGLLRYVTLQPSVDGLSGRASLGGTTVAHGEQGFAGRATLNVPLSSDSAILVNGFFRRDPGYVDDASRGLANINRQDVYGGRAAFRWNPTNALSVKLAAIVQDVDGDGTAQIDADANLTPVVPYNQTRLPRTGPYHRQVRLYSAQVDLDLKFATLTSLTGYNYSKFRSIDDTDIANRIIATLSTGDPGVAATTYFSVNTKKFVQELRLTSPTGSRFEWLVGGFYTRETSDPLYNLVAVRPATGAVVADDIFVDKYPLTYREIAGFANATYHFTNRFDLQLGGRYGQNKQSYHETIDGPLFGGYDVRTRSSEDVFTYSVSPRFRINRSMTLYARVATGYRPGGPNTALTPTTPEEFGSDRTTNYEVGFKGEFLSGKLYVEGSAFRVDWKDIQLQQTDPVTLFAYYDNAGGARSQGFELSATYNAARGLALAANVANTDAKLTQPAPLIAGSPTAGTRLPFSAPWTASFSADQEVRLGGDVKGSLGATLAYQDKRRGLFQSYGQATYPAFTTLDLRVSVSTSGWTLSAFASNVFDKAVAIAGDVRTPGSSRFQAILNRPRTLGVQVEKRF
jgi:outer membrane receptor protein involved in Fe transport